MSNNRQHTSTRTMLPPGGLRCRPSNWSTLLVAFIVISSISWHAGAGPRVSATSYVTHDIEKDNKISACQSGLREDNTNYIYCARQNLSRVPADLLLAGGDERSPSSSVLYDELVLSDNELTRIDNHSFAATLKVRRIYLDANPLRLIERAAFATLRNYLEELYFDQKTHTIDSVDEETSDTHINDNGDDVHIFQQGVFNTCFNLRTLSIINYRMRSLGAASIVRLSKLESLTLSHAGLRRVDERAFAGLEHSLVELNLESNELEALPSHALERLQRLRRLRLAANRIRSLHANAFLRLASASQLLSLDLSYNQLASVDESAFDGPVQNALRSLHVQNNELAWSHLIHVLFNLRQLVELNVDFNKLGSNSQQQQRQQRQQQAKNDNATAFIHLQLNTLSMQSNGLSEHSLSSLMAAYDYDELTSLSTDNSPTASSSNNNNNNNVKRFKFDRLVKLNLARNRITRMPEHFFVALEMSALDSLTLDRNPLDFTHGEASLQFDGLGQSLRYLSANNALLSATSDGAALWSPAFVSALNSLASLEHLKLNNNNKIKNAMKSVGSSEDNIGELKLVKLVSLELQNNGLVSLPSFLCHLPSLRDLDVANNEIGEWQLACLLDDQRSPLRRLNLNNNPLQCDCRSRDLRRWLVRNYAADLVELIKWRCSLNSNSDEPRYLSLMSDDELICPPPPPPSTTKSTTVYASSTEKLTITTTTTKTNQPQATAVAPAVVVGIESDLSTLSSATSMATLHKANRLIIAHKALKQQQKQQQEQQPFYMNYYSLIVGISFSISVCSMLLLVAFYLVCIREQQRQQQQKQTKQQQQRTSTVTKLPRLFTFGRQHESSSNISNARLLDYQRHKTLGGFLSVSSASSSSGGGGGVWSTRSPSGISSSSSSSSSTATNHTDIIGNSTQPRMKIKSHLVNLFAKELSYTSSSKNSNNATIDTIESSINPQLHLLEDCNSSSSDHLYNRLSNQLHLNNSCMRTAANIASIAKYQCSADTCAAVAFDTDRTAFNQQDASNRLFATAENNNLNYEDSLFSTENACNDLASHIYHEIKSPVKVATNQHSQRKLFLLQHDEGEENDDSLKKQMLFAEYLPNRPKQYQQSQQPTQWSTLQAISTIRDGFEHARHSAPIATSHKNNILISNSSLIV